MFLSIERIHLYLSYVLSMKKYVAELFGTAVLVLIGCGSAVIAGDNIGYLGISLAFGLAVLTMVYAIGPISGCHINPAITVAMWLRGKISTQDGISYIIAQMIGAALGAGIIALIVGSTASLGANGFGANYLGGYSMQSAFITEVVFTTLFLLVIFGATAKDAATKFAGVAIGLALAMIHMVTIPVTGTSVNPARSFGPALLTGGEALGELWLFIVAPLIGAGFAVFLWKYVFCQEEK